MNNIITRFAPSPTGKMHIGSARTALFSWIYAKKNNGKFLLRFEDTDVIRSLKKYSQSIIKDMQWLGITIDENPIYQTKNYNFYHQIVEKLLSEGNAYKCFCSKERLKNLKEFQISKKIKPKYDGFCRNLSKNQQITLLDNCKNNIIRFKNPSSGYVYWNDLIKNDMQFSNKELDDFVMIRSDGSPTYNLCVVLDDIASKVTHIIRGDDHLSNTPRQINLFNVLEEKIPVFAHLPMILGLDKKVLSKRNQDLSIENLKHQGYLPEALINYMFRLGCSNANQEIFSLNDIIKIFNINKVNVSAAIFDINKLNWLNSYYIKNLKFKKILPYLEYLFIKEKIEIKNIIPNLHLLLPIFSNKIKKLDEFVKEIIFLYEKNLDYNNIKIYFNKNSIAIFQEIFKQFSKVSEKDWVDESILKKVILQISKILNYPIKEIYCHIRYALIARLHYPNIGLIASILGKKNTLKRIKLITDEINL